MWSLHDEKYLKCYKSWEESKWNKWYAPSLDRIHSDLNYSMDNIQWISWRENNLKRWKEDKDAGTYIPENEPKYGEKYEDFDSDAPF